MCPAVIYKSAQVLDCAHPSVSPLSLNSHLVAVHSDLNVPILLSDTASFETINAFGNSAFLQASCWV